jgi:DAK2 domain fusion protein YloV
MGARGNSGVITSQLLRGIAESAAGKTRLTGADLADAFAAGTRVAYAAVAQPVEGTMLTVAREASEAAVAAAGRGGDVGAVLDAALHGAAASVHRTPSLLPILRESGVVDAGGQGLFRLLEGAAGVPVAAEEPGAPILVAPVTAPHAGFEGSAGVAGGEASRFGYETLFLLEAAEGTRLDIPAMRRRLESLGESVLVAGDERRVKVHVHGERPDSVIGYGLSLGVLTNISVENLDVQAAEVREAREEAVARDLPNLHPGAPARDDLVPGPAVVAVVAGEGLARVFEALGADRVIAGGQASNPSVGELLAVARLARAREVIVLPNNPNVRLAAEHAAAACPDFRIRVVPTRNPAEGLAALLALDPEKDAAANVARMTEAGRAVATLQVTDAVRDAVVAGRAVARGETIVIDPDEGIVAHGPDRVGAVVEAIATFPAEAELVTIYLGADAARVEAEAIAEAVRAARPGVEVELVEGGQPHYRYLIAAE